MNNPKVTLSPDQVYRLLIGECVTVAGYDKTHNVMKRMDIDYPGKTEDVVVALQQVINVLTSRGR